MSTSSSSTSPIEKNQKLRTRKEEEHACFGFYLSLSLSLSRIWRVQSLHQLPLWIFCWRCDALLHPKRRVNPIPLPPPPISSAPVRHSPSLNFTPFFNNWLFFCIFYNLFPLFHPLVIIESPFLEALVMGVWCFLWLKSICISCGLFKFLFFFPISWSALLFCSWPQLIFFFSIHTHINWVFFFCYNSVGFGDCRSWVRTSGI